MPDSALLVITTSLRTISSASTSSSRTTRDRSIRRRSTRAAPSTTEASASESSGRVVSVRKPRLPKLMARIGGSESDRAIRRAMPRRVPSPPRTRMRSVVSGRSAASQVLMPASPVISAVARSTTGSICRLSSHATTSVTTCAAASSPVLATIPTRAIVERDDSDTGALAPGARR